MLGLRDMIQSTSSLPEAQRRYTQLADLWSLSTDCELSVSSNVRSVQPAHAICGLGDSLMGALGLGLSGLWECLVGDAGGDCSFGDGDLASEVGPTPFLFLLLATISPMNSLFFSHISLKSFRSILSNSQVDWVTTVLSLGESLRTDSPNVAPTPRVHSVTDALFLVGVT